MLRSRRLNVNIILGGLLIIFGTFWYLWNPFKKDFDLSTVSTVTIDGEMPLNEYFSKKTILYFGYTTCPTVCPITLINVTEALKKYKKNDTKVIFISLSPRDTFKMTYDYGQLYHKNILGVNVSSENVGLLGEWLNLQYRDLNDGNINHSGNLYLFNDRKLSTVLPFGVESEIIVNELRRME